MKLWYNTRDILSILVKEKFDETHFEEIGKQKYATNYGVGPC